MFFIAPPSYAFSRVRLFLTMRRFSDLLLRAFVLTALLFYVFLQLSTIITERDHEKVIDHRRNSCRACAAQEDFHGIRLQSEKFISLILFTAPAPEGDFPSIGEGNGGALPYDPLFTLLLCDVLRTIWFPARHSAECTSANPRGLRVTKRGQDHPHLLLRCTACHPHRHDIGHRGDEKRGRHPRPCLGRNKPGGR